MAKNIARTRIIQLGELHPAIWRIFAELNIPLSPELAEKRAIEDENLTSMKTCMEVSRFSLFLYQELF